MHIIPWDGTKNPYTIVDISGTVRWVFKTSSKIDVQSGFEPIITITFIPKDNDIKCLDTAVVEYKMGTEITDELESKAVMTVEKLILFAAIRHGIFIDSPSFTIKQSHYIKDNLLCIKYVIPVCISSSVEHFAIYENPNFIVEEFDDSLFKKIDDEDYELIKAIFRVTDIAARYLFQYEYLANIVKRINYMPNKSTQFQITQFIINQYNSSLNNTSDKIKMEIRKNTRINRDFETDELTAFRNELCHPSGIISNRSSLFTKCQEASISLMKVIMFALTNEIQ